MTSALLWLLWRSGRNRVARMASRLREPRRLLAVVVGVAYLTWAVWIGAAQRPTDSTLPRDFAVALGSVGLFISCISAWLFGGGSLPLGLAAADVAFLLPAPIRRSSLLLYKLASTQVTILLNTLIWTLLTAGGSVGPLQRAVAVWLVFSGLTFHRQIAGVVRGAARQVGSEGQRRAVAGSSFLLIASALVLTGGAGGLLSNATEAGALVRGFLNQPTIATILWPFSAFLEPLVAPSTTNWLASLRAPMAILLLHVIVLFVVDRVAEEAVIRASLRRLRVGDSEPTRSHVAAAAPVWRLASDGPAWPALVWLHLTTGVRRPRLLVLLSIGAAILVGIVLLASRSPLGAEVVGAMALVWGVFAFAFGPQYLRNDLRSELGRLAIRRAWPIAGATQIVCAVLSATTLLTLLIWWFFAAATLGLGASSLMSMGILDAWPAAAFVVPGLCWLALLVQNGGAVLYPEWVAGTHGRGIEVLGLNLVVTALTVLLVAIIAALPALAGVMVWKQMQFTPYGSLLGGAVFLACVVLVSWPLVRLLGRELDNLEPVSLD